MTGRRNNQTIRVAYIMGSGRSGSTILDCILGNHEQIESVGELCNLPQHGWLNGEYCGCGQPGNICPFWQAVRYEWVRRTGVDDVEGYIALQRKFGHFRRGPQLLRERIRPSGEFQAYAEQTYQLLAAIRTVSGKPIIVDSSKGPARAFALSLIKGIDLKLIHLVRDARAVAYSFKKAFEKNLKKGVQHDLRSRPVWQTALFWMQYNLESEIVRSSTPKVASIRLRYEDLTADPENTLSRIGDFLDIGLKELAQKVASGKYLKVEHTIAGNRLRMAGKIRLLIDMEWRNKLTSPEKRTCRLVAGVLMSRYRYEL